MRPLLKFLHTVGAIGLMGSTASLLVLIAFAPEPSAVADYARALGPMRGVANWVFLPSLALTLFSGLLSMAASRAFQSVGWVWVKLATGILVFKAGLLSIHGPILQKAELSAQAAANEGDVAELGLSLGPEWGALWVMMALATANVALGVWRPRLRRRRLREA